LVALALALVPVESADGSAGPATAQASCRGPAALDNFLALSKGRGTTTKRVRCGVARTVVKRFGARCQRAYSWQGSCRIRAAKRWRCTSRLVGTATQGAPSSIKCVARRLSVRFTVKLDMSRLEPPPGLFTAAPGPPWIADRNCIDGTAPGQAAPPLGAPNEAFEIRTTGNIPLVVAEGVQAGLAEHGAGARLANGLQSRPIQYPVRLPVFLRKDPIEGITGTLCDFSGHGSVVNIGATIEEATRTAAHELFHAYAGEIRAQRTEYAWIEDLGAEWFVWRAGFHFIPYWEALLQDPNQAVDTLIPAGYRYALWRLIQFLDDKGVVHAGNAWPVLQAPIKAANQTAAFDQFLRSKQSSLGEEVAAFWGEHLKAAPRRPPRLVPVAANSDQILVNPGNRELDVDANGLHTKLTEFTLADTVQRVEFEFKPPTNGYFWGLVASDESSRFNLDQSVSFCVGGSGNEEIQWPGSFPVTFTNGNLTRASISGRILIYAQTKADQCKGAPNRACTVLTAAGARGSLGPDLPRIGGFSGHNGVKGGRRYSSCAYKGIQGIATIDITQWSSSKALRAWIRKKAKVAGWRILNVGGELAILFSPRPGHAFIQVAVGRQRLSITVHGGGAESRAFGLASEAIPEVR
jgi:hypothetical protein